MDKAVQIDAEETTKMTMAKMEELAQSQEREQEKPEIVTVKQGDESTADKDKDKEEGSSAFKSYTRIFKYCDKYDFMLYGVAFLFAIASGSALALVNIVFGGFVTTVNNYAAGLATTDYFLSEVNKYALYFLYLAIGRFVSSYAYSVGCSVASTRTAQNIRYAYFRATLSQEVAFFDAGQGSISIALTTNGNLIQQGTSDKLGLTVQAISAFVAAFVVAFTVSWKLTLIAICIVPFMVLTIGATVAFDAKWETQILEIFAQAGSFAEDAFSSMRTVHAFWARHRLGARYQEYLDRALVIGRKKSPLYGIMFSTEFFAIYAAFALTFWQGIRMFARGEIQSPGNVVTVLFSVVVAATSFTQVAPNIMAFSSAASAAAVLWKTIDKASIIDPFEKTGRTPEKIVGELQISDVNFAYPTRPDSQVLKNFDLKIPAGKVTALVGASGSGKSTIVGLLERWYDPNTGEIRLDGIPLKELNLHWLRTQFRLVQQEPVLFNATVFENVRYGLVGTAFELAPESEQRRLVEEACVTANAHDFVSQLPEGYDTEVGERAGMLSGGQKQRLAIARSVVSNPKVLLLDEATSALDPHAEGIVQRALDQASRNRTTIVIAHKLATIKAADNIVVMSRGQIVEQGTHESLIDADGTYARLVKIQDLGKATEEKLAEDESTEELGAGMTQTQSLAKYPTSKAAALQAQRERDNYDIHEQVTLFKCIWILFAEQKDIRWWQVMEFCGCLLAGGAYPAQAVLFSKLQTVFLLEGSELTNRGDFYSLMFFIVALIQLFNYFVIGWCANVLVQVMTMRYRRQMFDAVLRQDMQFFDRPENTAGALTSKLSSQPTAIFELMGFQVAAIITAVVSLVASITLAFSFGWKLACVVVFAGLPPLLGSGVLRFKLEQKVEKDISKGYATTASLAGESVAAIRTVSSLAMEEVILAKYRAQLATVLKRLTLSTLHTMAWFALTQSVEFGFMGLGFWYGCQLIARGEYGFEQFYLVFISIFFSGQAASQFLAYCTTITKAKAAANYVFWLRALPPTIAETPENQDDSPPNDGQSLSLDRVRFAYPLRPEAQVLKAVSLDVQPNKFIALVGASGCGKTTIVAMLERFYDPIEGRINVDETADIASLSPRLYRDCMSLVQQEPTLYSGTIRENIALGFKTTYKSSAVDANISRGNDNIMDKVKLRSNPKKDVEKGAPTAPVNSSPADSSGEEEETEEAAIVRATHLANAYEFVSSLPEGLDTQVGKSGIQLSGGQRQRIAIARALVRNPRILLLDEATSALDTESEKVVQKALADAAGEGGRITVAVAHRLSTIKDADQICVFMEGKIVEAGQHQDLLDRGGLYAKMVKAQSLDRAV